MIGDRDAVVVGGVRTPFTRAGTLFGEVSAVELGRSVVREALERTEIDPADVDEVIVGTVASPPDSANVARVIALQAKLPHRVPALTVSRNCGSGLESVVEAAYRIRAGDAELVVAAAVESMSGAPLLCEREAERLWKAFTRAKGRMARLRAVAALRPRHLRPVSGLSLGLVDPISGLNMGETAENLARDFKVGREEQDAFALWSHRKASTAWSEGFFEAEVVPIPIPPKYEVAAERDNGIREDASAETLSKLKPVFDPRFGTVTAGNASPISDGAVALVVASGLKARALGLEPLGKIRSWAFVGCDPARMGLGPVMASPLALRRAQGLTLEQVDLVEINEAFAAQVLACLRAFESRSFCQEQLGSGPVGVLDPERLNVHGGAIALGHPVGASGARLLLTLLRGMQRRNASIGLATLCIGGGQGGAVVVERS